MSVYEIGVAVVGAGFIGPVHVEALRRLGIPIRGILGCDRQESERARSDLGLPRAYESYEELLLDSSVTSVHLAVPNVLHYQMAKEALRAHRHVLCEKPLAMNSEESSELVELARSEKLAAGVCYNVRFYPLNLQARSMVERAVADIGTHWMDLITSITRLRIEAVFADLSTVHPIRNRPLGEVETFTGKRGDKTEALPVEIQTEDCGSVLFRFRGGAKGSLHVSQVTAGRKNCIRYEIAGSNRSLSWNSEAPNELWIGCRDQANRTLIRDPALIDKAPGRFSNYPGGHNEGFPDTFKQCFRAFYDYIDAGDFSASPYYPTFAAGHREIVLCEAILKSHRTERWVLTEED